jgi:antitoxin component YwqK of YwqJK toxin-antitoxin module
MADIEINGLVISRSITADYVGQTDGGKPNGWGKAYFPNGQMYDGEWKDGKMHGKAQEFYTDGVLKFEGEYKDGFREGFGKSYNREGKLSYEGEWKKGEKAGNRNRTNWA